MGEPDPFVKKNPGDIILASDWNQMQVRAREAIDLAIAAHRHTGAERDGPKLAGSALDPGSALDVTSLTVSQSLSLRAGAEESPKPKLEVGGTARFADRVGIGVDEARNRLEVQLTAARSGEHASDRALYVVGDLGADDNGVEFRHANGTQGIGFGFNTIYATGSNPDQDLGLKPRGAGKVLVTGGAPLHFDNALGNKIVFWEGTGAGDRYGFGLNGDNLNGFVPAQGRFSLRVSGYDGAEAMTVSAAGELAVKGKIEAGNSDLYFTKIDHDHTGFGNTKGYAAIENAKDHNALMILGRAGTDKGRLVKLWDYLEVNGTLSVTGEIQIAQTIRGAGRLHITGGELLYLLNKNGVVIGKEWGGSGDLQVQGIIRGRLGDVAELYLSAEALEPGDVVSLCEQDELIARARVANDPQAIGVISKEPAVLLNGQLGEGAGAAAIGKAYPVALCGRILCKVTDENGPIRRGDLLASASTPGFAMRAGTASRPGTIIGKALQPHAGGKGVIEIFVMLQ